MGHWSISRTALMSCGRQPTYSTGCTLSLQRDWPLNVLGAARFSVKAAGVETIQLGKSGFLHKSIPMRLVGRIHGTGKEPFHANDFPSKV